MFARAAEASKEAFLAWDVLFYQTMDIMDMINPEQAILKTGISRREHFEVQKKIRATIGHAKRNA